MNEFNGVAWIYDQLKFLMFRDQLDQASIIFCADIEPDSDILILGGGTGKVLEHLPSCTVDYVELSSQMILRAKQRRTKANVNFVNNDFLAFDFNKKYDFIHSAFFLDVFCANNLDLVLEKINKCLIPDSGELLVTDFNKSHDRPFLTKLMHLFFRLFTNLESSTLKDIPKTIENHNFDLSDTHEFLKGYVFSKKYTKHGNL